jgi:hypothetical protein
MMWTDKNTLYTDQPRQAQRHPGLRPMHKGAEWKADWWLGKLVTMHNTEDEVAMVRAAEVLPDGDLALVLERGEAESSTLRVNLLTANHYLRNGDWSLL